jgi:hypothetical protein
MDNLLEQLWDYYLERHPVQDRSEFRTIVHRLIAQLPTGQGDAFSRFNNDLQNWNNHHTEQNSNRLFSRLLNTLSGNINHQAYNQFLDYLLNPWEERGDTLMMIRRIADETDLSNSDDESLLTRPDSDVDSSIHSGGEEDGTNGGRRNPYALLEQKGHEGKFTAQFKARKPHLRHLKTLGEFAHYILTHPTEFNKISKQRANYYKNLIQRGSGNQNKGITKPKSESIKIGDLEDLFGIASTEVEEPKPELEGEFRDTLMGHREFFGNTTKDPRSQLNRMAIKKEKKQIKKKSKIKPKQNFIPNLERISEGSEGSEGNGRFSKKGGMMNNQTYISEFDDLLAKINRHRDMLPSMASDLPPTTQELFNPDIQTALNYINSHYATIVQRLRPTNITAHRNRFPMFHDGAEYRNLTNQTTPQEYTESINRMREFSDTIEDMVTQIAKDISNYEISQEARRGLGRLTKKMMKDLRAYHRQVGGKISTKDFNIMLKETYKKPQDRDKHIGDYYIDESLSTPENVVYHNPKTGETKVAYRGTEGTLKDWGNNALYAFGLHNTSKRYKRSNEIQKQVEQKYGTENLDVLGHSQSGAYAQEIGKNAKNVIVLNPATHPGYTPKTSNTTVVRSTGDAVSGLKYLNPLNWGKKKTADVEIKAETYNPVTEHMPAVLERLPEDQILGNGRKRKRRNKKLRRLCNCCGAKCPYCC